MMTFSLALETKMWQGSLTHKKRSMLFLKDQYQTEQKNGLIEIPLVEKGPVGSRGY